MNRARDLHNKVHTLKDAGARTHARTTIHTPNQPGKERRKPKRSQSKGGGKKRKHTNIKLRRNDYKRAFHAS